MTATCFTCHTNPAGFPDSPYSAYCPACQPEDASPVPPGSRAAQCGGCGLNFTSDSAFDKHQDVTGCHDPAQRGLVPVARQSGGQAWNLWGWPPREDAPEWVGNSPQKAERLLSGVTGHGNAQIPAPTAST